MNRMMSVTKEYGSVEEQRKFILNVYNWMASGLFATGFIAYSVGNSPLFLNMVFGNPMVFYALIIGELGLVFYLSGWINKMSAQTAKLTFMGYAALNGVTMSFVFLAYTSASITSAFLVTAVTFGAMSLYGYTTKKDLTSWGSFLFMGLIGIIIASLVNIFMQSPMIYWLTTYAGVLIFTGLTAYDTQKIKEMGVAGLAGTDQGTRVAVSGALMLYLDFINLFLMILRVVGGGRDD
ncbi:MAG: Bax inhibitor-1/YccA family protein [Nitrospinota bacterium]